MLIPHIQAVINEMATQEMSWTEGAKALTDVMTLDQLMSDIEKFLGLANSVRNQALLLCIRNALLTAFGLEYFAQNGSLD